MDLRHLQEKLRLFNLLEVAKYTGITYNQLRMLSLGYFDKVKAKTVEAIVQFIASL
jgi:DNA-binding Xre family transcriptional regulator